jgi:hypothetical protein
VAAARVAERPTWCAHRLGNLAHVPEKWEPVFRKARPPTKETGARSDSGRVQERSAAKAASPSWLPAGACRFDPRSRQDALAPAGCDFSSPVVRKRQFGYNATVTRSACISCEYWQDLWPIPRFFEASDAKSGCRRAIDFEAERLLIMVTDQNVGNRASETLARVGTEGWQ